jgi:Domain of unknown function (DUF4272)
MPNVLRSADEVATRLQCLAAVVTRAVAEDLEEKHETLPGYVTFTGGAPHDAPSGIRRWLDKEGLTLSLSPIERDLIAKPISTWTRQERLDGWWRREALMVLEWSLRIVEPMPPADTRVAMEDLLEGSWLFQDSAEFRKIMSLRSPDDVSKEREIAEFWLWRVRTTQLLRYSDDELTEHKLSREKLGTIVEHAAATGDKNGWFRSIDGDFPAFGKPFHDLGDVEWDIMKSICTERLYGLNWVCSIDGLDWDHVETNT